MDLYSGERFSYPCEERGDRNLRHPCDNEGVVVVNAGLGWLCVCDFHSGMYSDSCNKVTIGDFEKSLRPELLPVLRNDIISRHKEPLDGQA
jgi:hypothetical protein